MILAIDAGNTHIVLGCFSQDGELLPTFRIPTLRNDTEFGYASKIKEVLEIGKIEVTELEGAIISSSVPEINNTLYDAIKLLADIKVLIVGHGTVTNIKVGLNDPDSIGADLITAAVAARQDYPLPAIIIDLGTATTLTVINENEEFIGGAIMPGVRISIEALASSTSLLPQVELRAPESAISLDTTSCIQSGVVYGTAGSIDAMIDKFIDEMPVKPRSIIATGGNAKYITKHCQHNIELDDNLLLRGLMYIWNYNR